ncbi:DNA internalization-related competence protein ComEC/Rec2 [Geobacter sp. AOG2]|uniref:DNA internalization-related competence protein ComEC/Rec2 n=1 Tax=Geobacter sp. AOG2 TaxID=1566347 RepID=UPI001CC6A98C|nr:DNA internalization-related competence protein ComEC/Rec2 [Geobacter sp. AOG2]GFE61175.1 DNA internalization-related competence protein ComEC/Rec2 [Geobacter sp. AOG2]
MFRRHPLLIPFWSMAVGLCLADGYSVAVPVGVLAAVFSCLVLSSLIKSSIPFLLCSATFFFVLGLYFLGAYLHPVVPAYDIRNFATRDPIIVEGIVQSRPVAAAQGCSFVLRVEGVVREGSPVPACGRLMVYLATGDTPLTRGDRVRCMARITVPHRLGIPSEFDYTRYLAYQGVTATGRVAAPDGMVLLRGAAEDSLLRRFDLVSRRLGDFIRTTVPDRELSSVLTALLIGDQKRIPAPLNDAYTRAGVNHILSISGFHVGIIAWFIVAVALYLATRSEFLGLRFNLRRTALLMAVPAMLAYLFLTGAAPATARSVIMLAAFVLALHAERETDPLNALLLAAFVLVVVSPPSLFDLSFQLSFLALWGIVVAVPLFMEGTRRVPKNWQRNLIQFVAVSCAAACATIVPVLFYFGQTSLNGIISNLLIVPILGYGAVLTGFTALPLVYLAPPAARVLLWCAGQLTALSNWLVALFAKLPLFSVHTITSLDMLCFLCFMVFATFLRRSRGTYALCVLPPLVAVITHLSAPAAADGRLHVTMLSVGQGESLLVRFPDGGTMLVDGGGYLHDNGRDFGRQVLGPALWKLGVHRIDRLVLTHSHPDHIGGMAFLARTFPVGEFWEPAQGGTGEQYEQLRAALAERHVPRRPLAAGDELTFANGVKLAVLSPPRETVPRPPVTDEAEENEKSLVFRLSFGSFSMLFTADAGFPTEERILAGNAELTSTVLKAGHHGSRYSTSERLLGRVSPALALISAGRGNNFGLPARQTLERLRGRGIRTWRTDLDGTIDLTSDGVSWNVATPYRPD